MIQIYETDNPSNSLEINDLGKPNLPAVVSFYRSEFHSKGKYGVDDTAYDGEFGFDSFNEKVIAKGLATNYEKLDGVETKKATVGKNHQYLCPYLSIYPPNVIGNLDNTKNMVTLYVKLEEDKDKGADDPDFGAIHFQSSDPSSIEIEGTQENKINGQIEESKKLSLTLDTDATAITINCLQAFSDPIYITACLLYTSPSPRD